MTENSLSVTEAARLLGISVPTVKRMAADGQLQAFRTPGGHLRVTAESVELLREGGTKESRHREPSAVLKNRRERVEELGLEAQELRAQRELSKLRKEAAEESEHDRQERLRREREQRHAEDRNRLEQELQEQEREKEERLHQEAERHRMWADGWITEALKLIPRDCPREHYADVCQEVQEALDRLGPNRAEHVIRATVDSAVERGLRSWRRDRAIEKAIQDAEKCLPVWAKSICKPTEWQTKLQRMTMENIARLPVGASPEEIRAAGMEAGQTVARQYEEAEAAQQRLRRQEAKQREQALTIQLGLAHLSNYLRQLEEDEEFEFEDRVRLTRKLEKRIRPELFKEIEADPDLDYADMEEIVEELVDEFLPEFWEED